MNLTNCPSCFATMEIPDDAIPGGHVACELCERAWEIANLNPIELKSLLSWHQRPRKFVIEEHAELNFEEDTSNDLNRDR